MNKKVMKLLIMSLLGLISTHKSNAKWYHHSCTPRTKVEKVEALQDRFDALCEKGDGFSYSSFEPDPRLIGYQNYKLWPKQRRKLMRKELDTVTKILLSFPTACTKKEAIENLEKRIMLLKKAQ